MFIDKNFNVNSLGHLTMGNLDVLKLVEKFGTPLYVIDENYFKNQCVKLKNTLKKFYGDNSLVCYASKAFCCKEIYRLVQTEKMGIDVVSLGEMFTAIKAGFDCSKIYFHGNNKSVEEIEFAIKNKIGTIVVDNFDELNLIKKEAAKLNAKVNILLRLKPGVSAHVHEFIRTGQIDSKFGFIISNGEAFQAIKTAISCEHINLKGAHCHIGSQILEIAPFVVAAKTMMEFFYKVKNELNYELNELNLGGGFGINYLPDESSLDVERCFEQTFLQIKKSCEQFQLKIPFIVIEPGRFLIAKAGITLYTIGGVKQIPEIKTYVFVDGGMGDNPRYALYNAKYDAVVANKANLEKTEIVSIAGKYCESGDLIGENIKLQKAVSGDILAVFATGAYNYSMASNYNKIARAPVVFINNSDVKLVVKRESLQNLIENDL